MAVRAMVVLLATGVAAASGCSSVTCGPGTQQMQDAKGHATCVPAAVPGTETDCDVDGGALIVAGHCVSRTMCGANTQPSMNPDGTISCIGVATTPHTPPPCPSPPTGSICVRGTIRHLADDSFLSGESVTVSAHEPLTFLGGDTTPLKDSTGAAASVDGVTDTFILKDVKVTSSLFAIAVGSSGSDTTYQLTGCGAEVSPGGSYTVDCYLTPRTLVAAWKQQSGIDYDAAGAYVGFFFADPLPAATHQVDDETQPVAGVQLVQENNATPPMVHYFGGAVARSAATIDPALTQTGAAAGAILPNNFDLHTYTATGGMYMGAPIQFWEADIGASTAHLVFVQRFHRCADASCS